MERRWRRWIRPALCKKDGKANRRKITRAMYSTERPCERMLILCGGERGVGDRGPNVKAGDIFSRSQKEKSNPALTDNDIPPFFILTMSTTYLRSVRSKIPQVSADFAALFSYILLPLKEKSELIHSYRRQFKTGQNNVLAHKHSLSVSILQRSIIST